VLEVNTDMPNGLGQFQPKKQCPLLCQGRSPCKFNNDSETFYCECPSNRAGVTCQLSLEMMNIITKSFDYFQLTNLNIGQSSLSLFEMFLRGSAISANQNYLLTSALMLENFFDYLLRFTPAELNTENVLNIDELEKMLSLLDSMFFYDNIKQFIDPIRKARLANKVMKVFSKSLNRYGDCVNIWTENLFLECLVYNRVTL
jgi:hypothetical protein